MASSRSRRTSSSSSVVAGVLLLCLLAGASAAQHGAQLQQQHALSSSPSRRSSDGRKLLAASAAQRAARRTARPQQDGTAPQQQQQVMFVPINAAGVQPGGPADSGVAAVPVLTTQTRQVAPGGGSETTRQTQVLVAPAGGREVVVPVAAGSVVDQVVVVPGGQQPAPTSITLVPARPSQALGGGEQQGPAAAGPYCIPRSPAGLAVLGAGDSITQGSVPSKNLNHPYTLRMKALLEAQLAVPVRAVDAGLGGGGVFMTGFNVPTTFGPWLDSQMALGPWNVVVVMIGINDLLRGGRSADDIMAGLSPMLGKVLAAGSPVILMPPFAAPGFVQENDSKEAERKKLARLFRAYANEHAAASRGVGPQVWMLDLQATPFDFYAMPAAERSKWLDDGLHMTEAAYDTIGELVGREILSHMCTPPATSA